MSEHLENYRLEWSLSSFDGTTFFSYLSQHSTLNEMDSMFCEIRDMLSSSPCCSCHTGCIPVSVNSKENTPFVGGPKCNKSHRSDLRDIRRAFFLLSTGEFPTDLTGKKCASIA